MKLNAAQIMKTLKGENYKADEKDLTLGVVLAECLATSDAGGKMKSYLLAQKCYSEKEFEIDAADLSIIKRAVESAKSYNNLIIGQALTLLEDVK